MGELLELVLEVFMGVAGHLGTVQRVREIVTLKFLLPLVIINVGLDGKMAWL
jgi:hypothetical protein